MNRNEILIFECNHLKIKRIAKKIRQTTGHLFEFCETDEIVGNCLNSALMQSGKIVLTRKALEIMTLDELAYMVNHEIAHWEYIKNESDNEEDFFAKTGRISKEYNSIILGFLGAYLGTQLEKRNLELKMDYRAIELMHRSGFDIKASITALRKMYQINSKERDKGLLDCFMDSHPSFEHRILAIQRKINNILD